jgi:23S rRNA pseudouridine1911/1915/1917 synthase
LLIANKPAGTPVQPDLTGDDSLLTQLEKACGQPLFLINRVDRPVSGLVVFAKTKSDAAHLSTQFSSRTAQKTYLAAVKTAPQPPEALLTHFIQKQKNEQNTTKAFAKPSANTEKAVLEYSTIGNTAVYTFLKIALHTGRYHQIRAQLAAIGSPIKGDVKYGAKRANTDRSIHLHAWRITLLHPKTTEKMTFVAPTPDESLWQAVTVFIQGENQ